MALREFADTRGRWWRVWDVTSESIHPGTRDAAGMRGYQDGWLTFESEDGASKCRLAPIPIDWADATAQALEQWLHQAASVRGERELTPPPIASEPPAAAVPRSLARTFRFPGGRIWTVAECAVPERRSLAGAVCRSVLRFSSGSRTLELEAWPADWRSYTEGELADFLSQSFPREVGDPGPVLHRRRAVDVGRA